MKQKPTRIVVLSGPTGVGKTTVAQELEKHYGMLHVSTSSLISSIRPSLSPDRMSLQNAGNTLDQESKFCWIADEVVKLKRKCSGRSIVVDAVRKPKQVQALRAKVNSVLTHVHLEASYDHVIHRYQLRSRDIDADHNYDHLIKNESESYQSDLANMCDIKLNAENASPFELGERIISFLHVGAAR